LTNETEADTDSDKDNVDDTFGNADEEETSHYSTDLEDQSEESDQEQQNCGHDAGTCTEILRRLLFVFNAI